MSITPAYADTLIEAVTTHADAASEALAKRFASMEGEASALELRKAIAQQVILILHASSTLNAADAVLAQAADDANAQASRDQAHASFVRDVSSAALILQGYFRQAGMDDVADALTPAS